MWLLLLVCSNAVVADVQKISDTKDIVSQQTNLALVSQLASYLESTVSF